MTFDLPQHVSKRGKNSLQYRRRYKGFTGEFSRTMTSKQDSPQSVIQSEAIQMTRVYELELKAKHSISPNLISELEL